MINKTAAIIAAAGAGNRLAQIFLKLG